MVTLRRTKGAPLTHDEMDNNFAEVAGKVNSANPATSGTWTHTGAVNLNGGRPISLSPSMGEARIKGDAGAWAAQYAFSGSGGADFGGFGVLGNTNSLNYYYVGAAYSDAFLRLGNSGVLVHKPVPVGYGAGSGGTAIQPTNKSTAVVLNKPSGRITMHPASLAAGAIAVFQLYNSSASPSAVLALTLYQDGITDPSAYNVWAQAFHDGGGFNVFVRNISGAALSNAVQISFDVLEGAIA